MVNRSVLKHCKVPEYYDEDCRFLLFKYSVPTLMIKLKQIYLELKVSLPSFLNGIRIKILQNALKNIRHAVFYLIKFQIKSLQLY